MVLMFALAHDEGCANDRREFTRQTVLVVVPADPRLGAIEVGDLTLPLPPAYGHLLAAGEAYVKVRVEVVCLSCRHVHGPDDECERDDDRG